MCNAGVSKVAPSGIVVLLSNPGGNVVAEEWTPARAGAELPLLHVEDRFLVVDADASLCEQVVQAVHAAGGRVDSARDVPQAHEMLAADRHSVVLLDIDTLGLGGLRDTIRDGARVHPQRVYILLSRADGLPFDLTALEVDADRVVGVLSRPFAVVQLQRALRDAAALCGARDADAAGASAGPLPAALGRVLHLEDSDVDAQVVSQRLSGASGLQLHRVSSLAEAESALLAGRFDLAMVDLYLPDARGFDVLHRFRALRPDLPVVVLSELTPRMHGHALSLGAQEVVEKSEAGAEVLAAALHRARLRGDAQRELRYLATHDALTGLRNGAAFREQVGLAVARVRRQGGACGVLYIDLDGFKPINDRHGHDVGDVVLSAIGERLRGVLRECDLAARLGGDEFAVLLQDVSGADAARAVAQRVLEAVSRPVTTPSGVETRVTASVGIGLCPETSARVDPLIRAADAAMFVAKQAGRDRYHLAGPADRGAAVSDIRQLREVSHTGSQ